MKYDDDIEHIYLEDEDSVIVVSEKQSETKAVENNKEYKKFGYVLLGILVVSSALTFIRGLELNRFIADFMAVFFITFAAFKIYDIERFAHAYRKYDILAKRIRPWGYVFPFVEAFLGFWYLLSEGPQSLIVITILVTGTAVVGAWAELGRKSRFQSTSLGTLIRLPLSRIGFIGNSIMLIMAIIMLAI